MSKIKDYIIDSYSWEVFENIEDLTGVEKKYELWREIRDING